MPRQRRPESDRPSSVPPRHARETPWVGRRDRGSDRERERGERAFHHDEASRYAEDRGDGRPVYGEGGERSFGRGGSRYAQEEARGGDRSGARTTREREHDWYKSPPGRREWEPEGRADLDSDAGWRRDRDTAQEQRERAQDRGGRWDPDRPQGAHDRRGWSDARQYDEDRYSYGRPAERGERFTRGREDERHELPERASPSRRSAERDRWESERRPSTGMPRRADSMRGIDRETPRSSEVRSGYEGPRVEDVRRSRTPDASRRDRPWDRDWSSTRDPGAGGYLQERYGREVRRDDDEVRRYRESDSGPGPKRRKR